MVWFEQGRKSYAIVHALERCGQECNQISHPWIKEILQLQSWKVGKEFDTKDGVDGSPEPKPQVNMVGIEEEDPDVLCKQVQPRGS